jgi:hypothetical protein
MPRLEGSYRMEKLAENKTKVTHTVEVDIGGSIPAWMAKMVARDMPYKTLSSMRQRVQHGAAGFRWGCVGGGTSRDMRVRRASASTRRA